MHIRMTVFSAPKDGNADTEWEDKAVVRHMPDGSVRFIVLDGAAEAFDTVRWVDQIARSYAPASAGDHVPRLNRGELADWFGYLQRCWAEQRPQFHNLMEERKFHEVGSFATMLAGTVTDLAGPAPRWRAVALGDTVLFHVRGPRLLDHFPPLAEADFGVQPAGVSTKPSKHQEMVDGLRGAKGLLESGDTLFVATDALAQWMLRRVGHGAEPLFDLLGALAHPDTFAALIADLRETKEIVDDDVTLLRIGCSERAPSHLVVCR